MSITVEGIVRSVFAPDVPGGRFGLTVTFPPTIGGMGGANIVSVFVSKEHARAYVKHGISHTKVTLTIEEPPIEDDP